VTDDAHHSAVTSVIMTSTLAYETLLLAVHVKDNREQDRRDDSGTGLTVCTLAGTQASRALVLPAFLVGAFGHVVSDTSRKHEDLRGVSEGCRHSV
jgi:hypothetical protein